MLPIIPAFPDIRLWDSLREGKEEEMEEGEREWMRRRRRRRV
jgi:hypothetical protein